jgi:hypothetical protein
MNENAVKAIVGIGVLAAALASGTAVTATTPSVTVAQPCLLLVHRLESSSASRSASQFARLIVPAFCA